MTIYLALTFLATWMASLHQKEKSKKKRTIWFYILIIMLTVFSGIRDGIGIDYKSYLSIFNRIELGYAVPQERGFVFLVFVLKKLGISNVGIFLFFAFLFVFITLKAYDQQSKYFHVSVFFFMIMGFYFYSFNSIRYYVAVGISLYSCKLLQEKKYKRYVFFILLGALLHKSILVVFLIHMLCRIKVSTMKRAALMICAYNVSGIVIWLLQKYIRKIAFFFYPSFEGSHYDDNRISYVNILICIIVLTLLFSYYTKARSKISNYDFYFNMICIALVLYIYCYWIPELSRIGYYCMISIPIALTEILYSEQEKNTRLINLIILATGFLAIFIVIMRASYTLPSPGLLPYRTIFNR